MALATAFPQTPAMQEQIDGILEKTPEDGDHQAGGCGQQDSGPFDVHSPEDTTC
jgi:hypothetical protein